MIRGRRTSFEARCRERGYSLSAALACVVIDEGDIITVDETHPAYPKSRVPQPYPKSPREELLSTSSGPGTELKKLLGKIGITSSPTCSCNQRAKAMDENGIEWCEQNVETICDWLQEEATKRKLPFVRLAGKAIINLAIRRAKKSNSR